MKKFDLKEIINNNHLSIARGITFVEHDNELTKDDQEKIWTLSRKAIKIGITGPPGAGKSTLVNNLINFYLKAGNSVGVVAVDPSSPFTGGALLGDRVRMSKYIGNKNVYIRSLGNKGSLGGLSSVAHDAGNIIAASGKDIIIYETVGVGQAEHDIIEESDITVVILVPESGDEVQLMKAGLIEIADLFVINKSDRPGANRLEHSLRNILHTFTKKDQLEPNVYKTVSTKGEGLKGLFDGINTLINKLKSSNSFNDKRLNQYRTRVSKIITNDINKKFWTNSKKEKLLKNTNDIHSLDNSPHSFSKILLE